MSARPPQPSLVTLLEERVLPQLFERLDEAFPEFGWERTQDGWAATNRETTKRVLGARPERVICNRPYGFYAHGGEAHTWLGYVAGDPRPRGERFVAAVERLCELAGVPTQHRELDPEEANALAQAESRRQVLARVTQLAQRTLRGREGASARAYARKRGLNLEAQQDLGLGLFPSVAEVRHALPPELHGAAQDAGLFREQFVGYLVVPWLDDWGRPLTLYFRWPDQELPEGRPKTQALPGAGTKRSPLYFDRAKQAGETELVLVEGVFDAAVLQSRGETRVVACVAAQLSKGQAHTLARHRVDSVTLALDPDGAGEAGTHSCLKALEAAGILAYVAPQLPDGLDPDELVLERGVEAWRVHLEGAITGPCYLADQALEGVSPQSPRPKREAALRRVGEVISGLRGRMAARERAELVRLAAKATGFGVSFLKSELPPVGVQLTRAAQSASSARIDSLLENPYREDPSGLVWVRERFDKEGRPVYDDVPLANFCARITTEITEDDGADERRIFEVTAELHGRSEVIQVPALQFGSLQWVLGQLGASATLEPGKVLQERVRHAIQILSGVPPKERVYTHLGWRELQGEWAYLHAEGAIGAAGAVDEVRVRPEEPIRGFALPEPPEGKQLERAVAATLELLQVAPEQLTFPLLALPFRAVQGEVDFTAFLYGSSGNHKSCLAALVQQFFGGALHFQNLPGSWLSSANALEGTLFLAKDALFVIDDFIPTGSAADKARRHRDADRVLRGQGNRAGRSRMRCDATLRPTKRSRALVLCTGEELPRGESLAARMITLPVGPGDVDREQLSRCQRHADRGLYAQTLAAFLRWLAPNYGRVATGLRDEIAEVRRDFERDDAHSRLIEVGANLFLGLRAFARFLQELGFYTEGEAQAFLEAGRAAVLGALGHQVASQTEADPIGRFFELLASNLASGRAHVAGVDGNVPPENEQAWGWRISDEGQAESASWRPGGDGQPFWRAQGERVGWVEGDELYLDPTAVLNLVQRSAGEEGFPLSGRSLRRRLKEQGLLKGTSRHRDTTSVRVSVAGARRSVLHLSAQNVLGLQAEFEERASA